MRWMAAARHPFHKSRRTGSFRAHSRWNNVLSARLLCARARAFLCMDACTRVLRVCMDRCVGIAYLSSFFLSPSLSLSLSRVDYAIKRPSGSIYSVTVSDAEEISDSRDSHFSRAIAEAIESVKL